MDTVRAIGPGTLLVATPDLLDPYFRRTVVYVIAHGGEGTVGVILNRRSETAVHTVLPAWARYVSKPPAVYIGGPVQTSAAMCLGVVRDGVDPTVRPAMEQVAGTVALVNLDAEPADVASDLVGLRVYVGHAGWGEGQLAEEIGRGSWFVIAGMPVDVVAGPLADLWFRVLRRQPLPLALQAYHPGDVSRN